MGPATTAQTIELATAQATEATGGALASLLRPRDVVALHGDLGAGKTTLARGLIRSLMGDRNLAVPSPTFTLVEIYDTPRGALWHFDLYRLNNPDEAWELGVEQAFAEAISLIEWPQRLGPLLPAARLDVELTLSGEGRQLRLSGTDGWTERLAQMVKA